MWLIFAPVYAGKIGIYLACCWQPLFQSKIELENLKKNVCIYIVTYLDQVQVLL